MILKSLRLRAIIYYIACIWIVSTIPVISARTRYSHTIRPSASFAGLDHDEDIDEAIYLNRQPGRPDFFQSKNDPWSNPNPHLALHNVDLQSQQTEANALCAFKQGITNWPGSMKNGIYKCNIMGWNCNSSSSNGAIATSYPCNINTTWTGVTCNSGVVSNLNLTSCGFKGTISSQLSALTGLQYLWLRMNSFSSSIPSEISALSKLQSLNLRTNSLIGKIPLQISALTDLRELILYQNRLTGPILPPNACFTLKNLTYFNVRLNEFSQPIPSNISLLSKITYLNIRLNKIVGPIPSGLSVLTGLTDLLVRNNLLTSTLPSQLSTLTNLKFFNPNVNQLTGPIPSQLSTLIKLETLYLNENRFSSSIPSELSALTSLKSLCLHTNKLFGFIPSQLSRLSNLTTFFIANNKLSGSLPPSFSALSNLVNLLVHSNSLTGSIPHYISSFKKLAFLSMAFNKFTSPVPNIFGELSHLEILQLNNNKFSGELPPSLNKLESSLAFLDLSNNQLQGDPFFFIGFPNILFVNISSNHFHDMSGFRSSSSSSSSSSANSNNTSTLHYMDISSNYFEKSLPDTIGINFPSLKVFDASNNCFESYIPESLCKLTNLSSILLNKLGSQCAATDVSIPSNTFSDIVVNSRHTIPSCLLLLPHIQTAHLIGNYLFGTLSEVSSSLESLSLVGNAIVGTIPESIQQSFKLTDLQLSLNRLSGTLMDDAFHNLPPDSIIQLYSNRISGNLPSSLNRFNNSVVDILTGNLFYCASSAPKNLKNYETYSCGSSSIDYYRTVYIVIGACLALMLLALLVVLRNAVELKSLFRFSKSPRSFPSLPSSPSVKNEEELPFFYVFFNSIPFPRRPLYSAICNPQFVATCLAVALVNTIFNLVIYNIDYSSDKYDGFSGYSTHEFQYGYSSTFTYCHGKLPYLLITGSLSVTIFVYLHYYDHYNKAVGDGADNHQHLRDESRDSCILVITKEKESSPPSLIGTPITKSASTSTAATTTTNSEEGISRLSQNFCPNVSSDSCHSNDMHLQALRLTLDHNSGPTFTATGFFALLSNNVQFRWFLSLQLINVVVVTIVNVFYILLETDSDSTNSLYVQNRYKYMIPIVYSIFKILWSETFVTFMVKYGLKIKLSESTVFGHFMFSLLYINILVPIITVFFTDVNCFYYQMNPIPSISETYEGSLSVISCTIDGCVSKLDIAHITLSIAPSWIYGYQCSFATMINYLPAVLAKYTIVGIFIPMLKLAILYFPSTSWIRNAPGMNMFMQYTYNAMPGDDLLTNSVQRQFRTLRHIGKGVCDVLMLFTFGIFCPFLTFIIIPSIIFNELVNHLQLGSYLHDRLRLHRTAKTAEKYIDHTQAETDALLSCVYSSNARKLMRSMWKPSILTILFFSTLFFFDFIADSHSNTAGIIAVLVIWIYFIVFFFSRSRLERIIYLFTTFVSSVGDLRAQRLGRLVDRTSRSLDRSKQGVGSSSVQRGGADGSDEIEIDILGRHSSLNQIEMKSITFNEILNTQVVGGGGGGGGDIKEVAISNDS